MITIITDETCQGCGKPMSYTVKDEIGVLSWAIKRLEALGSRADAVDTEHVNCRLKRLFALARE